MHPNFVINQLGNIYIYMYLYMFCFFFFVMSTLLNVREAVRREFSKTNDFFARLSVYLLIPSG